jgi:chaperone modulatory protein CbpM
MMSHQNITAVTHVIVEEQQDISLAELCRCCGVSAEHALGMIDYGVIEPLKHSQPQTQWRFSANSVLRIQTATRLQDNLGVNLAGAVLALELLDEVKALRRQVQLLQRN